MPMLSLIVTLLVIGMILWLSNSYLPIDGTNKKVMNGVVVIVVVLWLSYGFGILGPVSGLPVG